MNIQDLIPYLGGIVPGMMTSGNLDVDPRALLIGGMMPGILNKSTGGSDNLSSIAGAGAGGMVPGMLNNKGGGDMNNALMKLLLSNYFGGGLGGL